MGQILSQSEVDAILSAVDFTVSQLPGTDASSSHKSAEISLYDFEHPIPLRASQLEGLRLAYTATAELLQTKLTAILRMSVAVNFLAVEQSTFRDYLGTCEAPACLAVLQSQSWTLPCLLDLSRSLAYVIVDCMLGGVGSEGQQPVTMTRPFTEVETRLIGKALHTLLPDLLGQVAAQDSARMTHLVSNASLVGHLASNDAVALVSFEVISGTAGALMQLCVPWKLIGANPLAGALDGKHVRDRWRSGAIKVPVIATARIARMTLSTRELAGLNPGDVLLTETASTGELCLDVDGHEIFRGTPGQSHDRKVIRLTNAVPHPSRTQ